MRQIFLFPAFGTDPVELELVGMNQISMARGDFILQFFNGIVREFLDFAAAGTDEVIVMLPFGDMLVSRLAISELDFACDARFGKELERAVHGCISYVRIP